MFVILNFMRSSDFIRLSDHANKQCTVSHDNWLDYQGTEEDKLNRRTRLIAQWIRENNSVSDFDQTNILLPDIYPAAPDTSGVIVAVVDRSLFMVATLPQR